MKYIKYLIIVGIFIFKGFLINVVSNINKYILNNNGEELTETTILKKNYNNLLNEYNEITEFKKNNSNNYKITRLSYREPYNSDYIYVFGNFNKYDLLVNKNGVVAIIKENKDNYSIGELITNVTNLNVKINDKYATLKEYKNNYFIIDNISNYDDIKLNDKVYTSSLGNIKSSFYIGYVEKIEESDVKKNVFVKSEVDFNNISYLYVIGES